MALRHNTMARRKSSVAIVAVGLLLASLPACGRRSGDTPERPRDPATVILRTQIRIGLATPADRWALPEFSLYGDGRAVVSNGRDGALLRMNEYRLTDTAVRDLFGEAASAGLFPDRDFDRENVVDGSELTISIRSVDREYRTTVDTPSADESGARGRVINFRRGLDLTRWPAERFAVPATEYRPDRMAMLVLSDGSTGSTDSRPWPLESSSSALRDWPEQPCVLLDGPRAAEVGALARGARPETRWLSAGREFAVLVRPMLPDERDCVDIDRT
jgi:hypothetical protein